MTNLRGEPQVNSERVLTSRVPLLLRGKLGGPQGSNSTSSGVTGCLPGWVSATAGVPQTAADLLQHHISAASGQTQTFASYSITSSARPRTGTGNVNPSSRAVLRFTTNSTSVDCWTGMSAGCSPFRILPT